MAETSSSGSGKLRVFIYGVIGDKKFQQAKQAAEWLNEKESRKFEAVIEEFVPTLFDRFLAKKTQTLPAEGYRHRESPLVMEGDTYVGGLAAFLAWIPAHGFLYVDKTPLAFYASRANKMWRQYFDTSPHKFSYFDVEIAGEMQERIIIELFTDIVPRTCQNFSVLASNTATVSYKRSLFHRVVKGGWVQGGDVHSEAGNGGQSIFGPTFEDESFAIKHAGPGDVAMASSGPNLNGSQFYISTSQLSWLDNKKVVFGLVVSGMRTVRLMEKAATLNERPQDLCIIANCGDFTSDLLVPSTKKE